MTAAILMLSLSAHAGSLSSIYSAPSGGGAALGLYDKNGSLVGPILGTDGTVIYYLHLPLGVSSTPTTLRTARAPHT